MYAYCVEDIIEEFNTITSANFTVEEILTSYIGVYENTLSMIEGHYSIHKKDTLSVNNLIDHYEQNLKNQTIIKTENNFYFIINTKMGLKEV